MCASFVLPARVCDNNFHCSLIRTQVETLEVGVLVNNVGMSYPHAEYFDAIDDKLIDNLITLNIVSTNKARCTNYLSVAETTPGCDRLKVAL